MRAGETLQSCRLQQSPLDTAGYLAAALWGSGTRSGCPAEGDKSKKSVMIFFSVL